MTDRPRPGLCSVCHVEARAPGQPRCTACQTGWERRAASTNCGIKLTAAEREALQGDP